MKNYKRPEPEVRVKASTIPQAVKVTPITLSEFPTNMESLPGYHDFVRSSHARPSAWVRFGKIEIKAQNLSPSHAKELGTWLLAMGELAESNLA
jgi:hypothetical protein